MNIFSMRTLTQMKIDTIAITNTKKIAKLLHVLKINELFFSIVKRFMSARKICEFYIPF